MKFSTNVVRAFLIIGALCSAPLFGDLHILAAQTAPAQSIAQNEQDGDERSTARSEEFISTRPPGKNTQRSGYRYRFALAQNTRNKKDNVGPHRQQLASKIGETQATIGVTIARARRATEDESHNVSIAKVPSTLGSDFVLERITYGDPVTHGTLMQMMIEYLADRSQNNRLGYLYVINRVQYADGSYSPPRLIFPTQRTYGGDSRVMPGKVVTLPDPKRLWEVSRNSSRLQAFETYVIIISPTPLQDAAGRSLQGNFLGDRPLELDEQLVGGWVKLWGGGEVRADLISGSTKYITQREQAASGNILSNERDTNEHTTDLTQTDLPPQTVFRKILKPGGKMLVTIKLPFKDSAQTAVSQP